jgi:hypothetical protein
MVDGRDQRLGLFLQRLHTRIEGVYRFTAETSMVETSMVETSMAETSMAETSMVETSMVETKMAERPVW